MSDQDQGYLPPPSQGPQPAQVVSLRVQVEIELVSHAGETERLAFVIVPDKEADFYSGLLSQDTPMARAILGRPAGSTVPYSVGDSRAIRILAISPAPDAGSESNPGEAAERRRAAVEEAKREVDRTNTMIYASSMNSKWGDYDPDHL